jgi:organic radical activating enzyme
VQGNNPIRPPAKGDGSRLEVKHLFPTLQGEGPYTGHPAVFVRLGGCNLACHFCDTDFENFATHAVEDIVANVIALAQDALGQRVRQLVVITGGEPLRQNIAPLCAKLQDEGFKIQIETNGTLYRPLPEGVDIICSPKNAGQGYGALRDDILQRVTALKFIISKHDERYNHVADVGQSRYQTPVYVQPMDEQDDDRNMENRLHALALAERHGYILSLQTHKILGIE